ncbi:hypothetical protein [Serratia sp. 14-2641]|uniref:hypothetical protein n=1 Tax=Serratia sp. 14-2641 TaxID=1841657 RepID=UPI00080FCACB|nr:hypothetical protein [Serratia sp. 14-2641]OCJ37337.1 hypothetical protein A6U95_24815 [Serratia sp. 14-2641]
MSIYESECKKYSELFLSKMEEKFKLKEAENKEIREHQMRYLFLVLLVEQVVKSSSRGMLTCLRATETSIKPVGNKYIPIDLCYSVIKNSSGEKLSLLPCDVSFDKIAMRWETPENESSERDDLLIYWNDGQWDLRFGRNSNDQGRVDENAIRYILHKHFFNDSH